MSDNNTSSFCYRTIAGTNVISNHGKGRAIDINPLQNPQVSGNDVTPKVSTVYADRSSTKFGMIRKGDDCYNAFVSRGWSWGGYWKTQIINILKNNRLEIKVNYMNLMTLENISKSYSEKIT